MRTVTAALVLLAAGPALAEPGDRPAWEGTRASPSSARGELEAYVQCAPYARAVSGIQIFGEARDWWERAQGRYATGAAPRAGAVMTFRATRALPLGHVATVSRVLDPRRVLLDHANWSPVDGRRGRIEKNVLAIDVSPANDWSAVRVWYAPLGAVGTSAWPVAGFIYPQRGARPAKDRIAAMPVAAAQRVRAASSPTFRSAFADLAD